MNNKPISLKRGGTLERPWWEFPSKRNIPSDLLPQSNVFDFSGTEDALIIDVGERLLIIKGVTAELRNATAFIIEALETCIAASKVPVDEDIDPDNKVCQEIKDCIKFCYTIFSECDCFYPFVGTFDYEASRRKGHIWHIGVGSDEYWDIANISRSYKDLWKQLLDSWEESEAIDEGDIYGGFYSIDYDALNTVIDLQKTPEIVLDITDILGENKSSMLRALNTEYINNCESAEDLLNYVADKAGIDMQRDPQWLDMQERCTQSDDVNEGYTHMKEQKRRAGLKNKVNEGLDMAEALRILNKY